MPNPQRKANDIYQGQRITSIWALIAIDADGDEGVPAMGALGGLIAPCMATATHNAEQLARIAPQVFAHDRTVVRIELRRFGADGMAVERSWDRE